MLLKKQRPDYTLYNKEQKDYDGGRVKNDFVEFMSDPSKTVTPPPPEKLWSDDEETSVVLLNKANFETSLKEKEHVLVMFAAPWCGHCKRAKPEYSSAAEELKDNSNVMLGAVDCTVERDLCQAHEVRGYPTFKYFSFLEQNLELHFFAIFFQENLPKKIHFFSLCTK